MPELPEVEALVGFLRERAVGCVVTRVDLAAVNVLKTVEPPPTSLAGLTVTGVARLGKWIDLDVDGLHLVMHLSKAGWVRWFDEVSTRPLAPGRGPMAIRVALQRLDDGLDDGPFATPGFALTEAGTRKRLAVHIVRDPREVPAIARLGPDPLDPSFDVEALRGLLTGRRVRLKGLLRDQSVLAGVGNAYSDEVLHVARLSPYALAADLTDEQVERLSTSLRAVLAEAVVAAWGRPAGELKDAKRRGMRVHGRTGAACPVCGDTVREVSFADSSLQYCPTCQTGGRTLVDRRMSRLLK